MLLNAAGSSVIVVIVLMIVIVFAFRQGRRSRQTEIKNLQDIANDNADEVLKRWMITASENSTDPNLCRHFQKHVNELFNEIQTPSDREVWSASCRNLLDIYDIHHNIEQSSALRIGRMMLKFQVDPAKSTPPPTALTPREVKAIADAKASAERERQRERDRGS
jgi:hypothetical protein